MPMFWIFNVSTNISINNKTLFTDACEEEEEEEEEFLRIIMHAIAHGAVRTL